MALWKTHGIYTLRLPRLRRIKTYVKARERVDVSRLASTLEQLDYAYPYHQSIGFLMSRAGFDRSDIEKFKTPGLRYDFYLAHGMPNASYDPDWKLYYPRDIDT